MQITNSILCDTIKGSIHKPIKPPLVGERASPLTGFVGETAQVTDDFIMYASACVLRSKMACAVKWDYNEKEVCRVNLTPSPWRVFIQRQDACQDVWNQVWMQWMTITSFVPCYALHVLHVGVSLFGPLNQVTI